jgi:4-hydroxybenzoate polyprenyltransferase
MVAVSGALFFFACASLNRLTLILSPFALALTLIYSLTKRFTWLSHFILGFTDGLAPMGAWAAIRGSLFTPQDLPAWILLGTVTFWIGGFDLIYACQDVDFDRLEGLKSIPAQFGIPTALVVSNLSHFITIILLVWLGIVTGLIWSYWIGLLLVAGLLAWEHSLVHPDDLSKVNIAFFNVNGYISIILFLAIWSSLILS